jgi:hypothetical protein
MVADLISTDAVYYGKLADSNLEPGDDDDDDATDDDDNDDNCSDPPEKKVKASNTAAAAMALPQSINAREAADYSLEV